MLKKLYFLVEGRIGESDDGEAIGQLMTIEHASDNDILAVAVPASEKINDFARQWRNRPLMKSSNIHIITVGRDNKISGLESQNI